MGSCFARNVEKFLSAAGMNVPAASFKAPPEIYVTITAPNGILNKYNTHSIEAEVAAALIGERPEDDGLIETSPDLWWDPLTTSCKPSPRDLVVSLRHQIRSLYDGLRTCGALIITLGLNEVWFDTKTGLPMNEFPPAEFVRKNASRFVVKLSDFEDNIISLRRALDAILSVNPAINIVVTVSPVPMGTTMTPYDIIQANSYSKSMLRVCAQRLANDYPNVDYFPSYEIAMNSKPESVWQDDRLHVKPEAISYIVGQFIQTYIGA